VLASSNSDRVVDGQDKDLAVADLSGLAGFLEREDDLFGLIVGDDDLELELRKEIDDVFRAAIELSMSLLTPEAFDFADGQPLDARLGEPFLGLVEFEWLDDGFDFLQWSISSVSPQPVIACGDMGCCVRQLSLGTSLREAIPAAAKPLVVPSSMKPGEPERS
jgi:hypothetical protein